MMFKKCRMMRINTKAGKDLLKTQEHLSQVSAEMKNSPSVRSSQFVLPEVGDSGAAVFPLERLQLIVTARAHDLSLNGTPIVLLSSLLHRHFLSSIREYTLTSMK
jgi:hypothetical protein